MSEMQGESIKGKKSGITRRKFIATTTGTAAAAFAGGFPNIVMAADPIRSVGLGVSIINEIQSRASKDIGFQPSSAKVVSATRQMMNLEAAKIRPREQIRRRRRI